MSNQENIDEFFSRILSITNQMNAYGYKQSDLGIIDKVLRTLIPRFDQIVVAIEQSQNLEEMKIGKNLLHLAKKTLLFYLHFHCACTNFKCYQLNSAD